MGRKDLIGSRQGASFDLYLSLAVSTRELPYDLWFRNLGWEDLARDYDDERHLFRFTDVPFAFSREHAVRGFHDTGSVDLPWLVYAIDLFVRRWF